MRFLLSTATLLLTTIILSCTANTLKNPKQVQFHVEPQEDNGFFVRLQHEDEDYQLKLKKPENSIFGENFKFLVVKTNEDGIQEFDDQTPSDEELNEIENHLYVDQDSQALLKVHQQANGDYHLKGYVNNLHVETKDGVHYVRKFELPTHDVVDYVDLHRPDSGPTPLVPGTKQSTVTAGQPEIVIVFDYANTQLFAGNTQTITDYLSIFYHAVQAKYLTSTDPVVTIKISGLVTVSARSSQSYMENNKIAGDADNAYDMNGVLTDFSKWAYSNMATLPKFDAASLISGENWKSKDANGNYQSGIAGLAYVGGACWKNTAASQFYGTSVNADQGAYYAGVNTVAHELAHNLNSPHDGDGASASCSWNDGYIMSYLGWGTKNKFYFSSCTKSLMKTFIDSTNGACVKTLQSTSQWTLSSLYPGDKYDMTAQCNKFLGTTNAVVETSGRTPSDLCRNLKCRVPVSSTSYSIYTLNRVAGENSVCATGMVCRDGDCIAASG